MPIDFTQKKAPTVERAGTAKIPVNLGSRAGVVPSPPPAKLDEASRKSPLQHPGDRRPAKAVKSKPRTKGGALVPEIDRELYIRGTARKSVLIEGPEQTIDAFKAFVRARGVKNWEGLQLLVQDAALSD